MKKLFLILAVLLTAYSVKAQDPSIDAGPDQVICPPDCADLTAVFVGGGGNTSDYDVSVIPFAPDPYAGTSVVLSDDDVTGAIAIGFDFCFYGNSYSECYIGSNGWVSFSPGEPTTFTSSTIPSTDASVPKNCIMGPWYDIDPGDGGEVRYQTLGIAPSRRFVVSYIDVPHFLCGEQLETYQIIIYETTNEIENHLETKNICVDWDDGQATQGVHNIDGTEAVPFPGRNNTAWDASNDGIAYSPLGDPDVEWYDGPDLIGVGPDITVCPLVPTTYTVKLISCGVEIATDDVLVDVICCEPPVMSKTELACFGDCDATATAEPAGIPPFTYLWDAATGGQTTATAVGLCAGTYTVEVADSEGCNEVGTITIDEPDELLMTLDLTDVSCAGAADGAITITAAGGTPPYTYDIGAGAGGINVFNDIGIGDYTVTLTDANGCTVVQLVSISDSPLPVVSFTSDINDGCEPIEVIFTNTGESGVSCEWNFGDGTSSTSCGPSVTHVYSNAGLYDVSLTVTNVGGCFTTFVAYDFIEVYEVPTANFIFNPVNPTTLDPEVDFTDYSISADGWLWDFGGFGTSTDENPTFIFPEQEGIYDITLTVITDNGCTNTITKSITVNQEQLIFVPNVITPDGDTFNEVFKPYFTGIDIYDYHLTIYNRWGEIMFESYNLATGWNGTFGGDLVQDGVYIWHITTAEIATDKKLEFHGHVTVVK
ncbi:MAG: PKD domain-containing protein [Crocinitomix sp.]|nr:PKD domain-containing protein [Crocinitomix sp.]